MAVRARRAGWGGKKMAMAFQWSLAALETLMAEDQMDQHAAVLRAFSVVELWRLRRVCRAFHRWVAVSARENSFGPAGDGQGHEACRECRRGARARNRCGGRIGP